MKRIGGTIALLAVLTLGAAPANASRNQEAMFQDDSLLVYKTPAEVARTMSTLRSLGVDRLRISVYWSLVAPSANSSRKPNFGKGGESDPAAYDFARYDAIVRLAASHGMTVNFDLVGGAPRWARRDINDDYIRANYYPKASDFAQFVKAAGTRYSGSYRPPAGGGSAVGALPSGVNQSPVPGTPDVPGAPGGTGGTGGVAGTPTAADPLPRVSYWSIWNEPNQAFFLTPQSSKVKGVKVETATRLYRALADAAARGLSASGHAHDTVLVGELAPVGHSYKTRKGSLKPMIFMRRLYCLNDRLRPLTGRYAAALGCPTTAKGRAAFAGNHRILFSPSGFSVHPYVLLRPPNVHAPRDFVGPSDIGRVSGALRRIFRVWHTHRSGLPIYNTEFGYQSRPPDPLGEPLSVQSAFINESEYIGWRNPALRSYMQFLLVDAADIGGFQTGLRFANGKVKPAYSAFRMPIWIPNATRGHAGRFTVWGCLRPAPNGSRQKAVIQFRPRGSKRFHSARVVSVTNSHNYFRAGLRFSRSGGVRIAWRNGKHTLYSRVQAVRA